MLSGSRNSWWRPEGQTAETFDDSKDEDNRVRESNF